MTDSPSCGELLVLDSESLASSSDSDPDFDSSAAAAAEPLLLLFDFKFVVEGGGRDLWSMDGREDIVESVRLE